MAGLSLRSIDPMAMPIVLPSPAAPITRPSSTSGFQSPIGLSRSRNAMNIVKNPDSQRGPQLARSANATAAGMRVLGRRPVAVASGRSSRSAPALPRRGWRRPAPAAGSPRSWRGRRRRSRSAVTTPVRRSTRGSRSAPRSLAPTMPASETRALALTRVSVGRQQSGDRRRARHAVGLGRDETAQRRREQPAGLGDHRRRQHPAEEAADRHGRADGPPAAVAEPVEERARSAARRSRTAAS